MAWLGDYGSESGRGGGGGGVHSGHDGGSEPVGGTGGRVQSGTDGGMAARSRRSLRFVARTSRVRRANGSPHLQITNAAAMSSTSTTRRITPVRVASRASWR